MSRAEVKASASLALVFALRMLCLFLILPVFSVHAKILSDGDNATLVGWLLFVLDSFIAAGADNIYWVIIGRALQGAGAISPAVTAFIADSTREEHRTKAMALVGGSICLIFALSLMTIAVVLWLVSSVFILGAAATLCWLIIASSIKNLPRRCHKSITAAVGELTPRSMFR